MRGRRSTMDRIGGIPGDLGGWISGGCMGDKPTGMAERILMMSHTPERPSWSCGACGDPWPCLVARVTLRTHMTDETLRVVMAAFVHSAVAGDLPLNGTTYDRFYGWINADKSFTPVPRYAPPITDGEVSPHG